jgi:hypothetical protein
VAEITPTDATNRAKAAREEQARLAMEAARASEQASAVEKTRVAAEMARKAEEMKAAETTASKAVATTSAAEEATNVEPTRLKVADKPNPVEQKLAALTPPANQPGQLMPSDISRLLQTELRRVGCSTVAVDGNWNAASQKSLGLFNKHADTSLDIKAASLEALDVVRGKSGRICPLICDRGFKADGNSCVRIACRSGYRVGDNNECEKIPEKKPAAAHEESPKPDRAERTTTDTPLTKPSLPKASGGAPACATLATLRACISCGAAKYGLENQTAYCRNHWQPGSRVQSFDEFRKNHPECGATSCPIN